jgi:hypothetical protein
VKFNHIDKRLSHFLVKDCQDKFHWLTTELGVRETNEHVGTGLGGNNFQLLVLMDLGHILTARPGRSLSFSPIHGRVIWGADWLRNTPRIQIRYKLDEVFASIAESFKYKALAYQALCFSNNIRSTLNTYKDQFPQLTACLAGKLFRFDAHLSNVERLIQAFVMCQELAADLDNNNLSRIQTIGAALYEFPSETILLSVRRYIGISRLVKHNLDEDPIFNKCLRKVTKLVD